MKGVIEKLFILMVVVLILPLLPLAWGCGPQAAPSGTPSAAPSEVKKPKEIIFYHIGDITGPYAAITGSSATAAMDDWAKYRNEQGGIVGVPVRIELTDTRNERDAAMSAYSRYREAKPVLISLHQAADIEMLRERLAEDEIPAVCTSPSKLAQWPPGWAFQSLADYADQTGLFIDWLSSEWAKSGQTRKCRLALFNPDYSYGHSHTTPEIIDYIKQKNNIEIVAEEYWDWRAVDVTTDIARLKPLNPDWIFAATIAAQPSVVLKSAQSAGIRDKAKFAFACWGMGPECARVAGFDLIEGVTGAYSYPLWVDESEGVTLIKDRFKKANRVEDERTMAYLAFWIVNEIGTSAVQIVVDKWGWENLDGAHVYEALKTMKDVPVLKAQPFTFAPGKRSPLYSRICQFKKGEPIAISDWLPCPDLRPAEFRKPEYGWQSK